ncbi:aspartyl protease family protein [Neotamlana sedimentorum]|uniref:aspartyl protease family protein n=1 Tax=Neotamlana sedimentorum TaxID=1435349 RepID=UPI0013F3D549|nr:pepsin/retropepsin-like aspartic protease family protein [Tamlana sedimentorum]
MQLEENQIPDSLSYEIVKLRNDNYIKLFDYQNAYSTATELTSKYRSFIKSEDVDDEANAAKIWKTLKAQKPQKVHQFNRTSIPVTRDLAQLPNVEIESNGKKMNFVFDTGAGISSIQESVAIELEMIFMDDLGIKIKGFNGIDNDIKIALAKELIINGILIENVPFLVFKNEALTFANGAYKINGIIGFPIAKELGTIEIFSDRLVVSKGAENKSELRKNLFVESLHPIILMNYQQKTIPFILDTGAQQSQFSKQFYETFKTTLRNEKSENRKLESAGGSREYKAIVLENIVLNLGDKDVKFNNVEVDIENDHILGKEFYGNIGQDLLKNYESVTISFEHNYLLLKN